ncbi:DUF7059 domain-containing protein [Schaalia suimastitidis]|uniref:DUF7059 domain-containing protein n=1 Tax=Schaalia suimastitidis TaxID=121163 RepID=UPI0003FF801D|nr:methyltransferase [Schaalia suimastitidis]
MTEHETHVPVADSPRIPDLAADLQAAAWNADRVEQLLGPVAMSALSREEYVPAARILEGTVEAAGILTRFFMLGVPETTWRLDQAMPTLGCQGLRALGLIAEAGPDLWRAAFDLRPHQGSYGPRGAASTQRAEAHHEIATHQSVVSTHGTATHHWWILSDLPQAVTRNALPPHHVMGIGGATTSLLAMTPRHTVQRALDVGCGCGIQALYLATHADHVVATDISARACQITRFNAALNGVSIDVRQGSLYEPVAGEIFDLIVSNPPFVITPPALRETGLLEYRDAGMERDSLVGAVIVGAQHHLREGGTVHVLANWEIDADADPECDDSTTGWPRRLHQWCHQMSLDVWAVQRDVLDPTQYAELWLRDGGSSHDEYDRAYRAWMDDFAGAGIQGVGMGFIAARRVADPVTPIRVYDFVQAGRIPSGVDVLQALDSLRLPAHLEQLHLVTCDDVTEERHYIPGNANPSVVILHQGGGMGRAIQVSSAVSALVGACDGELSVGQILVALAALMDEEVEQLRYEVLPVLERLLRAGMLKVAR